MLKNEYGYELDYDREENVMFINISGEILQFWMDNNPYTLDVNQMESSHGFLTVTRYQEKEAHELIKRQGYPST